MLIEKLLEKAEFSDFDSRVILDSIQKYTEMGLNEKESVFKALNDFGLDLKNSVESIKKQIYK